MAEPVIRWWRTDLGEDEIAGVATAIHHRRVNQGAECAAFEAAVAKYLGARYAVTTTSGSVALLLALKACGVGPGDEVIVPALTFIAPAHAALWLGATVRLVDVLPDRPVLNPVEVERAVSARTKAIVCVHLNGRAVDLEAIRGRLPRPIPLVEDCAQALGSRSGSRFFGTAGDAGTFSLSISKLITTGEGGFVVTADAEQHCRLLKLRNQGTQRIADNLFPEIGFNFRMTDIQAAIGSVQLRKIDDKIAAVRRIYRRYEQLLRDLACVQLLDVNLDDGEVPLWVEARSAERATVIAELARRGIEAKAFHPSLADSPHVHASGDFPHAARFAAQGLILPCGPDQDDESLARVGTALHEIERITQCAAMR